MKPEFDGINKIRVFISSKMDKGNAKYINARKLLNFLLSQNEMIQVTSVDDTGSSNNPPMDDAYLRLRESHICVFLFENSGEVRPDVKREHEFAKENGIARLYYFCKSSKKHETIVALRNELEKDEEEDNRRLYYEGDCFADLSFKAYINVLEEVAKGYIRMQKHMKDTRFDRPLPIAGATEPNIISMGDA